jgi:hypothetical protein
VPLNTICIDEIGPYNPITADGVEVTLNATTVADSATEWFVVVKAPDKKAKTAGTLLDRVWFCRYPQPACCIFDNGNEVLGPEFQEVLQSYDTMPVPTTLKKPTS